MRSLNIDKIIDSLRPSVHEALLAGERNRIKCYIERRDWQLEQFKIGWTKDWSQDELIFALRKKLSTLRKAKITHPHISGLSILPMVRVALYVEIEATNYEAA